MEWSTASARGAGLSLQLRVRWVQGCENQIHTAFINKPTGPVGDCCGGGWVQPLADNTTLHYFVRIGDWRGSQVYIILTQCYYTLKADHPLFDWLINCVILNHF